MATLFFIPVKTKGLDDTYFPIDFYLKTSDTQKYISLNREQKQFNLVSLRTKRPGQETGLEKKEGPKGQIISKRLLVSSDSSKKRTNEFGFV